MSEIYTVSFKPSVLGFGGHDASAAIFRNGCLECAAEEERFTRVKHAPNTFPLNSINFCLDKCQISLNDVNEIIVPYEPSLHMQVLPHHLKNNSQPEVCHPVLQVLLGPLRTIMKNGATLWIN